LRLKEQARYFLPNLEKKSKRRIGVPSSVLRDVDRGRGGVCGRGLRSVELPIGGVHQGAGVGVWAGAGTMIAIEIARAQCVADDEDGMGSD